MLGTHNSFTYQKAAFKPFNWFKFLWRCQTKTIEEQKAAGVEYFDIRVRYDEQADCWRTCHGIVSFGKTYDYLSHILEAFADVRVRLVLERSTDASVRLFRTAIDQHKDVYANLSFACIKKGWEVLHDVDPVIKDYTYTPWLSGLSFWQNIRRMGFFSTIKRWSRKHNTEITDELKSDVTVHFMDYV